MQPGRNLQQTAQLTMSHIYVYMLFTDLTLFNTTGTTYKRAT